MRRVRGDVPDVPVREHEPRASVRLDLVDHAVEAGAVHGIRDLPARELPQPPAESPAALVGPHDVEAQERATVGVPHDRDARDELAVEFADEEPLGIRRPERGRIAESRVPALGGGPLHGGVEFGPRHPPHRESVVHALHSSRSRAGSGVIRACEHGCMPADRSPRAGARAGAVAAGGDWRRELASLTPGDGSEVPGTTDEQRDGCRGRAARSPCSSSCGGACRVAAGSGRVRATSPPGARRPSIGWPCAPSRPGPAAGGSRTGSPGRTSPTRRARAGSTPRSRGGSRSSPCSRAARRGSTRPTGPSGSPSTSSRAPCSGRCSPRPGDSASRSPGRMSRPRCWCGARPRWCSTPRSTPTATSTSRRGSCSGVTTPHRRRTSRRPARRQRAADRRPRPLPVRPRRGHDRARPARGAPHDRRAGRARAAARGARARGRRARVPPRALPCRRPVDRGGEPRRQLHAAARAAGRARARRAIRAGRRAAPRVALGARRRPHEPGRGIRRRGRRRPRARRRPARPGRRRAGLGAPRCGHPARRRRRRVHGRADAAARAPRRAQRPAHRRHGRASRLPRGHRRAAGHHHHGRVAQARLVRPRRGRSRSTAGWCRSCRCSGRSRRGRSGSSSSTRAT